MTLSGQPGDSILTFELSGSTTITGFSGAIVGLGGSLTDFDAFSPAVGSVNVGGLPLLSGSASIINVTQGEERPVDRLFLQDKTALPSISDRFGVHSSLYTIAPGDTVAWSGSGTVDLSSQAASFDDLTIGTGIGFFDAPSAAGEMRLTIQLIPEPTTFTLLGLGSLALVSVRRRRFTRAALSTCRREKSNFLSVVDAQRKDRDMNRLQNLTRWPGLALACGIISFAASVSAQRPVILSFEPNGLLTWSNAYPNAVASVERLSDVVTTGSVVTVTETLGVSDGSTAIYSHTVEHPPIVSPSVTISDGTYSWNDETGSSSPANFLGTVGSYASGQVTTIYLTTPSPSGTVIQVEYSYLPLSTHQEWLSVYSVLAPSQVMQVTVDMSADSGLFRVVNRPSPMVLIPGGSNSGTNPLGSGESYDPCFYPATYSLTVDSFFMDRYLVTKAVWDEVADWAASHGYDISASTASGMGPDHPVYSVSWYACVRWCNARSEMENRIPAYYTSATKTTVYRTGRVDVQDDWVRWDTGYRLPMSEEWEYAARGGAVSKRFPWGGDTISHAEANYYAGGVHDYNYDLSDGEGYHPSYYTGDVPYTSPVGSFAPNAYGLYDMAGNVAELCSDLHPCTVGTMFPARVVRNGSWSNPAEWCRVGYLAWFAPYTFNVNTGFRTVLPANQ